MAAAYSSRDVVEDFLRHRGVVWRSPLTRQRRRITAASPSPWRPVTTRMSSADVPVDSWQRAPPRLQAALRSAGAELERRLDPDLCALVSAQPQWGAGGGEERRRRLAAIRDELFRDGVNWGRIVAMMALGGALSAQVARTGETGQLDDILDWMEDSLESPRVRGWMEDNGGWDAFVELYESRPPVGFWSLRTVFGLVVLGAAGVTLGVLFAQR
ncbi:apoptosis regulator Bcl-2-like [Odontesthes bonariensis]|uniref:apoptosis regulator Bcl-2-like n=1 Tax=Odontesthes bonariensis TaxID=219752 RepID=UPI003F58077F